MSSNPTNNNNASGQYHRRHLYPQQPNASSSFVSPSSGGNLPPASELLSPSPVLGYPIKARQAIHSVASPNMAPPSPFLVTPNNYQALTEPGTPATFLSVDPVREIF
jgi:hypothetical protein